MVEQRFYEWFHRQHTLLPPNKREAVCLKTAGTELQDRMSIMHYYYYNLIWFLQMQGHALNIFGRPRG